MHTPRQPGTPSFLCSRQLACLVDGVVARPVASFAPPRPTPASLVAATTTTSFYFAQTCCIRGLKKLLCACSTARPACLSTTAGSTTTTTTQRYPRPNPKCNPVPAPPFQSATQREVFARKAALARAANDAALPALVELVDFCATQGLGPQGPGSLFDVANCPGLADLTANGTLAPFPSAAAILERFTAEFRALELGHGFTEQQTNMDMSNLWDPAYPFLVSTKAF